MLRTVSLSRRVLSENGDTMRWSTKTIADNRTRNRTTVPAVGQLRGIPVVGDSVAKLNRGRSSVTKQDGDMRLGLIRADGTRIMSPQTVNERRAIIEAARDANNRNRAFDKADRERRIRENGNKVGAFDLPDTWGNKQDG